MHNECINTYAKNAVRVQPLAACPPVPLNPSSSLQKPSINFIKRKLFPPVEMHYNTNSIILSLSLISTRKRYMKFSRKPFNRDADCECVARTHKVTAREVVDCITSRTGGREGGRGVCFARGIPRDGYIL